MKVKSSPIWKSAKSCLPASMTTEWEKQSKQVSPAARVRVLVIGSWFFVLSRVVLCCVVLWLGGVLIVIPSFSDVHYHIASSQSPSFPNNIILQKKKKKTWDSRQSRVESEKVWKVGRAIKPVTLVLLLMKCRNTTTMGRTLSFLGFSSREFGGQEYEKDEEIAQFATSKKFPGIMIKLGHVTGSGASEVWKFFVKATNSSADHQQTHFMIMIDDKVSFLL